MNITIIGLDAVGASLGLALGTLEPEALATGRPIITGWDADRRTLREARGRLVIDREARDAGDAVREADVVLVSVAQPALAETFSLIAPHVKHGAIVSDTSSTKAFALDQARQLLPTTIEFVGGHPLVHPAGSTLEAASIDLFKGHIYCLVPGMHTRPATLDLLAALVGSIGAKPYYIDAVEHDAYVAGADQLPVLLAAALMEAVSRAGGWREMQSIAGTNLRAMTTLVRGDPATLSATSASNAAALERWLNDTIRTLVELRDQLQHGEQLTAIFEHARTAHEQWLVSQPDARPGENDLRADESGYNRSLGSLIFGQRRNKNKR